MDRVILFHDEGDNETFYSNNRTPGIFCARVPADRSAAYLWEKKNTQQSSLRRYRNGIQGRPLPVIWGRFLERIEERLQWLEREERNDEDSSTKEQQPPPASVVVDIILLVVAGSSFVTNDDDSFTASLRTAVAEFALLFANIPARTNNTVFSVSTIIWTDDSSPHHKNEVIDDVASSNTAQLYNTDQIRALLSSRKPPDLIVHVRSGGGGRRSELLVV